MTEQLRPSDRIKQRRDFRRVQGSGVRAHTRHFVLTLDRSPHEAGRIGITITRKVGNAVERNRVKRLVREVFRRNREWFPPGLDVVFIAKRGAPTIDYETLREEVRRARRTLQRRAAELLAGDVSLAPEAD
ncbi:MAG: ribonuclease P protein component [Deltaproteobacteria bacterium]|nr:ribonuclease P protein component [Deltaproteobacteria bacterium]